MTPVVVAGIDPGEITGIVVATAVDGQLANVQVVQCSANAVSGIVAGMLNRPARTPPVLAYVGIEQFVDSKFGRGAPAKTTRDLVAELESHLGDMTTRVFRFKAADHKVWNRSGDRLRATPLFAGTEGMRHARDAARVLLYTAVRDAGLPDPLTTEGRRFWS